MRFDPVHAGRVAGVNTQIKRKGTVSMTLNTVQHIRRWLCIALLLSLLSLSSPLLAGQDVSQIGGGGYSPPNAGPTYVTYIVRNGDSLTTIAGRFGVSLQTIVTVNGLRNANAIYIGQALRIPVAAPAPASVAPPAAAQPPRDGPGEKLIPDSEAVYSPAYADFDVNAVVQKFGGYLAHYSEDAEGEHMTGAQIIQIVSERFSVGPRVLLTLLEMQGGWLTNPSVSTTAQDYPMQIDDQNHTGLYYQVWWAANFLNAGYYGKLLSRIDGMVAKDDAHIRFASDVNPGTAAVQYMLSRVSDYDGWPSLLSTFKATYQKLWGDTAQYAIEPLVPADVKQPVLRLPWQDGQTWYYTGGPHGAWADGSAWAAVDFAPPGQGGCSGSSYWEIAAASGRVAQAEHGRVMLNLDGNDFQGSGWTLMYMHVESEGRVQNGAPVYTGDRIGHPSCEGGFATGLHLHIARMYNGQWMSVASQAAFDMSGWIFKNASQEYDGAMVRGYEVHMALNGHNDRFNGIVADAGPTLVWVSDAQ